MPETRGKSAETMDMGGVRAIAYRLLAIREHSSNELKVKLQGRGVPEALATDAVAVLETEGLVSDLRFAQAFTRNRISRTQGPLKIRAELLKRGVQTALIEQVLSEHAEEWTEIAQVWVHKRARPALDRKERARLYRSGTGRGFSHEHMMYAINSLGKEE